jgi:hypothetical protein
MPFQQLAETEAEEAVRPLPESTFPGTLTQSLPP